MLLYEDVHINDTCLKKIKKWYLLDIHAWEHGLMKARICFYLSVIISIIKCYYITIHVSMILVIIICRYPRMKAGANESSYLLFFNYKCYYMTIYVSMILVIITCRYPCMRARANWNIELERFWLNFKFQGTQKFWISEKQIIYRIETH